MFTHDLLHRAEVQSRYPEESTLTPLHSLCLSSSWVIAHRHRSWGYLWPHPLTQQAGGFNAVAVNHVICPLLRNPKAPSWYTSQTHCDFCASSLVCFDLLRVYIFLKKEVASVIILKGPVHPNQRSYRGRKDRGERGVAIKGNFKHLLMCGPVTSSCQVQIGWFTSSFVVLH